MAFSSSSSSHCFLLLPLLLFSVLIAHSAAQGGRFTCNSSSKCQSLVGYLTPNATTLSELQSLFTVKKLRSILGANNLPLSTPRSFSIPANQTIKIPIPCVCSNGTGISDRVPIYKVKKDDGLFHIAADVFGGLVQFQHIVEINNIPNPDLIEVNQSLWIPLPCSCDEVNGERVVHYAHVVLEGSSVEEISSEFGVDKETLLKLNGISGDNQLIAAKAFDVPLRACNSSIRNDSLDFPLLVSNNTSVFTANNCVKCSCSSANNWILQCEPTAIPPSSNSGTCPSMLCAGSNNLSLGNTSTTSCNRTTCSYAGFSRQTIHTTLLSESTCATPLPPPNHAPTSRLSWNLVLISVHLLLLSLHFLL
ncbi:lysM domain-containing GPI-anchored protein 2 [Carica papaya]|uniref:lysM domain-containing GPI-anchored protein 2 n=1 Tax=Carica papaya TaxID=3649 RepID=UPI000B8D0CD1|nr:lysM domain-containing GPI-anchored protein 2 [Carica papaya]